MIVKLPFCECGECGLRVTKKGNRFINGHQSRGLKRSNDTKLKISKTKLKERDPLPDDWEINKDSRVAMNKSCSMYLGCYIAEQILSKIFKNVKMMPFGNHGYDIICDNGYKIDIKSSSTGDKNNNWHFIINKNTMADYFLCIAFDNREDLNPEYLWLIPGYIINKYNGITIYQLNLKRWSQYEQPIDKVRECCNEMRKEIKS